MVPDEYLTDVELNTLKTLVNDRLGALAEQARGAVRAYTEVRDRDADPVDSASNETDPAFSQRLGERDRKMAQKLRHALERMKEGEYGVCERCGDAIGYRRLLARPVATCIDCKTTTEMLENPGRRKRT